MAFNIVMLSVAIEHIMLSVIMLRAVKLNLAMLNVMAP